MATVGKSIVENRFDTLPIIYDEQRLISTSSLRFDEYLMKVYSLLNDEPRKHSRLEGYFEFQRVFRLGGMELTCVGVGFE